MRKSNRKFRLKHPNGIFQPIDAIAASQDTTPEHVDGIMKPVRAALQALLDGKAGDTEYRRVGSALNVATVRAGQIGDNDAAVAVRDAYPVTPGHTLVIPRRHVASYFDATPLEREAMLALLPRLYKMPAPPFKVSAAPSW